MILSIISLGIFLGFFIAGCIKIKGIPECISDLYYIFGKWFTLGMFLIGGLILPVMLEITPENYQVFAFLCCAGLIFVGAAGNYKDKFEYPIHYTAACISGVTSIIWTAFVNPWCLLFGLTACLSVFDRKRWLLWCEIACFGTVYLSLLLTL